MRIINCYGWIFIELVNVTLWTMLLCTVRNICNVGCDHIEPDIFGLMILSNFSVSMLL